LEKLGFKIKKKFVANLADYVFPWIILGIALLWQGGI